MSGVIRRGVSLNMRNDIQSMDASDAIKAVPKKEELKLPTARAINADPRLSRMPEAGVNIKCDPMATRPIIECLHRSFRCHLIIGPAL